MLASVGFEMACSWRICWSWQTAGAALGRAVRVAIEGRVAAELLEARASEERNMAAGGVESVEEMEREVRGFPSRDLQLPMGLLW